MLRGSPREYGLMVALPASPKPLLLEWVVGARCLRASAPFSLSKARWAADLQAWIQALLSTGCPDSVPSFPQLL